KAPEPLPSWPPRRCPAFPARRRSGRYRPISRGRDSAFAARAAPRPLMDSPPAAAAPWDAAGSGADRGAFAWRRHRALFLNFVRRELTTRYVGSVTGFAWALLHPVALLLVYQFVFTTVFRAGAFGGTSFLAF